MTERKASEGYVRVKVELGSGFETREAARATFLRTLWNMPEVRDVWAFHFDHEFQVKVWSVGDMVEELRGIEGVTEAKWEHVRQAFGDCRCCGKQMSYEPLGVAGIPVGQRFVHSWCAARHWSLHVKGEMHSRCHEFGLKGFNPIGELVVREV